MKKSKKKVKKESNGKNKNDNNQELDVKRRMTHGNPFIKKFTDTANKLGKFINFCPNSVCSFKDRQFVKSHFIYFIITSLLKEFEILIMY